MPDSVNDDMRVPSIVPTVEAHEDKTMVADKLFREMLAHDIADEKMARQLRRDARRRIAEEKWHHEHPHDHAPAAEAREPALREDYFREHAGGFGYVFGLNCVSAQGALSRYVAKLFVLQGVGEQMHYEYHELVVANEDLIQQLRDHQAAIEDEDRKVLVQFAMVNPRARTYVQRSAEQEPKIMGFISGFLVDIRSIKIDDQVVYPPEAAPAAAAPAPAPSGPVHCTFEPHDKDGEV